jgi:hypothetical protein
MKWRREAKRWWSAEQSYFLQEIPLPRQKTMKKAQQKVDGKREIG